MLKITKKFFKYAFLPAAAADLIFFVYAIVGFIVFLNSPVQMVQYGVPYDESVDFTELFSTEKEEEISDLSNIELLKDYYGSWTVEDEINSYYTLSIGENGLFINGEEALILSIETDETDSEVGEGNTYSCVSVKIKQGGNNKILSFFMDETSCCYSYCGNCFEIKKA
ncbi:MAG: hypothetical protein LUC92_04395 [Clostridiales bacterium]|nr:hypothetical protein [Clostridiales bacterium]